MKHNLAISPELKHFRFGAMMRFYKISQVPTGDECSSLVLDIIFVRNSSSSSSTSFGLPFMAAALFILCYVDFIHIFLYAPGEMRVQSM